MWLVEREDRESGIGYQWFGLWCCDYCFHDEMPYFCGSVVMLALKVLVYEFLVRKFSV